MNLNKAIIVGRLTRDPESRTAASGQSIVNFGLATNRVWTDQNNNRQEVADYHNIVVFGKLADICAQYLAKGRLVLIEGRIQTRSWEDKDGNKKYRTEIVAENMQMGPRGAEGQGQTRQQEAPTQGRDPDSKDVGEISQDDIPVIEAEEPAKEKEEVDVKNIPF